LQGTDEVIDFDPIASTVLLFMDDNVWSGSATHLLRLLVEVAENNKIKRTKDWPGAPYRWRRVMS